MELQHWFEFQGIWFHGVFTPTEDTQRQDLLVRRYLKFGIPWSRAWARTWVQVAYLGGDRNTIHEGGKRGRHRRIGSQWSELSKPVSTMDNWRGILLEKLGEPVQDTSLQHSWGNRHKLLRVIGKRHTWGMNPYTAGWRTAWVDTADFGNQRKA